MTIELHGELHEHLNGISEATKVLKDKEDLNLVILSSGGSIEAIVYFNYLKKKLNDKGHKIKVTALVAESAAAFWAIMADEFTIVEGGYLMFHNMRYKNDDMISITNHHNNVQSSKKIDDEIIKIANKNGFLTKKEINLIKNGQDLYILQNELLNRKKENRLTYKNT